MNQSYLHYDEKFVALYGIYNEPRDGENDLSFFAVADTSFCPDMIKARVDSQINVAEMGLLTPMLASVGIV